MMHLRIHHVIMRAFMDTSAAPSIGDLGAALNMDRAEVVEHLHALRDYHGVVLHPHSDEIWAAHPFSAAPTSFWVTAGSRSWWGNCAWCSLGIAALVDSDVTISTSLGAEGRPTTLHLREGRVVETDFVVHFPIPMRQAWDNVVYTCSTMLLFENEHSINEWSARHRIAKGDVQPVAAVWALARRWYGRHLDADWTKWSVEEAAEIFRDVGLRGPIWDLSATSGRF
jgi:Alkylmercury lyase